MKNVHVIVFALPLYFLTYRLTLLMNDVHWSFASRRACVRAVMEKSQVEQDTQEYYIQQGVVKADCK
jgi:hypothetical protein